MGNYDIERFNVKTQNLIREQKIDDGNGIIEVDNGELAKLLSATGESDVSNLLKLSYSTNTDKNIFFKQYIEEKANQKGVKLPKGLNITISSPAELSTDFTTLLREVRTNIYGARINDMFNLIVQDIKTVENKVSQMEISSEDANKILELKKMFDSYYKIEATYNGETYNLLQPNFDELEKISPEFAKFIQEENKILRENSIKFTKEEISADVLKDAGENSVNFLPTLMGVLAASFALGMSQSAYDAYNIKYAPIVDELSAKFKSTKKGLNPLKWFNASKDFVKGFYNSNKNKKFYSAGLRDYITEQKTIANTENIKTFVNPVKSVAEKMKNAKGKWGKILALGGTFALTALGSIDDCCGCTKDYKQDKDNFGKGFALPVALGSGFFGVASSFAIAETIDHNSSVMQAKRFVTRNQNKNLGFLQKMVKSIKPSTFKTAGKLGLVGMIIASCSSGSSWASMAATRWKFGKNGDELVAKNIISAEENTIKSANDNMMEYAAYIGKWRGIAVGPTADPVVGFTFGSTGLLSHYNPYIAGAAFGLQGSSETWTASVLQGLDNSLNTNEIESMKKDFIETARK